MKKIRVFLDETRRYIRGATVYVPNDWDDSQINTVLWESNGADDVHEYLDRLESRGVMCDYNYDEESWDHTEIEYTDYEIISEEEDEALGVRKPITVDDFKVGRVFTLRWHDKTLVHFKYIVLSEDMSEVVLKKIGGGMATKHKTEAFVDMYNRYGIGYVDPKESG